MVEPKIKYVVYSTGCENLSEEFIDTLADLKEEMKDRNMDEDWDGDIIGYKCVPIFKLATEVIAITQKK